MGDMKKFLLLFSTSLSFASITWQAAEEISLSSPSIDGVSTAVDNAGNGLAVAKYLSGTRKITATVHTASGSSWGSPLDLSGSFLINLAPFAGATGQFVVPIYNTGNGAITSRTVSTAGSVGSAVNAVTSSTADLSSNAQVAAPPNGAAMLIYLQTTSQTNFSVYTPSSNSWSTPTALQNTLTVESQRVAADAGGNYGVTIVDNSQVGRASFKIGSNSFSTLTQFDTGVLETSIAAQVKATDTDGLFLVAYSKTDNRVYAQLKAAGSSTSLTDLGEISSSAEMSEGVQAAMNKNGDGVVAWNTDSTLIAAKYSAATNTFSSPVSVANDATLLSITSDSSGNFHLFYDTATTVYSTTMNAGASTWSDPVTITTSATDVREGSGSTNPRAAKASLAFFNDGNQFITSFGSTTSSNHGAAAGSTFTRSRNKRSAHPFR